MLEQIIMAGFGGQGVLSMGKMLAEAAVAVGCEVTWLPSYGPEMRGGTSNVSVNISDKLVGAPTISPGKASCVIAMNRPSLEKFEDFIKPGGLLLINSSIIDIDAKRTDITVVKVPANDIATELGSIKAANMVMLGAYLEKTKIVDPEVLLKELAEVFGPKKAHLLDLNRNAIAEGAKIAQSA